MNRRMILFAGQGGLCYYCNRRMKKDEDGPFLCTVDEKYPRSRGGRRVLKNQVAACKMCNNAKGSMTEAEFRNFAANTGYFENLDRLREEKRKTKSERRSAKRLAMMEEGRWGSRMPKPQDVLEKRYSTSVESVFGDVLSDLRKHLASKV